MSADVIHVLSGVSAFTGKGFVTMRWGAESGQLTPAEARTHALHVLECAEAAESDSLVVQQLERLDLSRDVALSFLVELRKAREAGR